MVNKGDYIKLIDSDQIAEVVKVISKSKIEVALHNGFIIQVHIDKTEPVEAPKPIESKKVYRISLPPPKVDLHIECLTTNFKGLSNAEKIQIQLEAFENQLSAAIAGGMLEITFVHGVGEGKLRNEIHKRLKKNKAINRYQDAQFDRGATLVKIF